MQAALIALLTIAAPLPDWLAGRWAETSSSAGVVELTFARSAGEMSGVMEEVAPDGRRVRWVEYVITQDESSLSLLLKEGTRPFECLVGNPRGIHPDPKLGRKSPPCYYGDKALAWKRGGGTYRFKSRPSRGEELRFELIRGGRHRPGMYPFAIDMWSSRGELRMVSFFGPQHGAALQGTFTFRRMPAAP